MYVISILTILGLITTVNVSFQSYLRSSLNDARTINFSGRQRMLSQKITAEAILIQKKLDKGEFVEAELKEMDQLLSNFKKVHNGLVNGDEELGLQKITNPTIHELFNQLDPYYSSFASATASLIQDPYDNTENHISAILENRDNYLYYQDKITNEFEANAEYKLEGIGRVLLILSIVSGVVLLLELIFIFRPTIKRLKSANSHLDATSKQYKDLYNKTPTMLHSIDHRGKLIMVSDFWLEKMGYSREEVIGKASSDFLTPESREYAKKEVLPLFFKTGKCSNVPYQFVKKDGEVMETLLSAESEVNENGDIINSLAVVVDISEKVRNRKELEASYKELLLIDKVSQASLQNTSFDDLLDLTMQAYQEMTNNNAGRLYLYSNEQNKLELKSQNLRPSVVHQLEKLAGIKIDTVVPRLDPGNIFHMVIHSGEMMVFKEPEQIKMLIAEHTQNTILKKLAGPVMKITGIKTSVLIPLVGKERIFGLVTLTFNEVLNDVQIERIRRFNNGIAAALDKAFGQIEIKRLAKIVSHSNDAIMVISKDGKINSWNDGAQNMFGYSTEEILGEPMILLSPESQKGEMKKLLNEVMVTQNNLNLELIKLRKNGDSIYVSLSLFPIRDEDGNIKELSAILRDISDKKRVEKDLIKSEALLKEAQKISKMGSWEWNVINNHIQWSDELFNLLGLSKDSSEELSYQRYLNIVHPEDKERIDRMARKAFRANTYYHFSHRILKSNKVRYIECRGNVEPDNQGNLRRAYGIAVDITDRIEAEKAKELFTRKLEKKVEERTKELMESQKKLEKSLIKEKELGELKSHFVSTASHQFRTPLTIILSNSELIEIMIRNMDESLRSKFEKASNRIKQEIFKMTELMDDVLILGKLASNNFEVALAPTNLKELCIDLVDQFNAIQTDGRKVIFSMEGIPHSRELDEKLINHALSNLLSNAFKYSPDAKSPELNLCFEDQKTTISIRDYGIGIPEDARKKLFQPFFRASNTGEFKGSGLGLNIAKEYIEYNNGELNVQSKINEGTEITITFSNSIKKTTT